MVCHFSCAQNMPGPASQVVPSGVCFATDYVLGLFPLCRGLSSEKKDECWLWILSRHVLNGTLHPEMQKYFMKYFNTSALTVLAAHKDGEMEESEALPQVPCSEFQFLLTPFRSQKGKWRRQLVGTQTTCWFWQQPRAARHSAWCIFNHLTCVTQCQLCSPAPPVTALVPGAFKVMRFCFIFVTTHADRSTRNISDFSDHFWGFLFSCLCLKNRTV